MISHPRAGMQAPAAVRRPANLWRAEPASRRVGAASAWCRPWHGNTHHRSDLTRGDTDDSACPLHSPAVIPCAQGPSRVGPVLESPPRSPPSDPLNHICVCAAARMAGFASEMRRCLAAADDSRSDDGWTRSCRVGGPSSRHGRRQRACRGAPACGLRVLPAGRRCRTSQRQQCRPAASGCGGVSLPPEQARLPGGAETLRASGSARSSCSACCTCAGLCSARSARGEAPQW